LQRKKEVEMRGGQRRVIHQNERLAAAKGAAARRRRWHFAGEMTSVTALGEEKRRLR